MLVTFVCLLTLSCSARGPIARAGDTDENGSVAVSSDELLIVDSDPSEPSVPLNLAVTVRPLAEERLLRVTVRASRNPSYPAARFLVADLRIEIHYGPVFELQDGKSTWLGNLAGDETAEFLAVFRVQKDVEEMIEISAVGKGTGGRIDADRENFHVSAKGDAIQVALRQFSID